MVELRALVAEALDDKAIDDFLREADGFVHGHPPIRLPQAPYDQAAPLRDKSLIRLASSPRLALTVQDGKAVFNAYDKTYHVPVQVKPALEMLNDRQAVSLAELYTALDGEAAVASLRKGLAMLARAGVVVVEQSDAEPGP